MAVSSTLGQQGKDLPVVHTSAEASSPDVPALRKEPQRSSSARPRHRWLWLTAGVVGVLVGGLVFLQPWRPALIPVPVEQITMAPATRLLALNGRIAPVHSVDLRALVSGRLTQVAVNEGQEVTVGQSLAQIDASAQAATVRQALAGLDAARVAQEQAEARYTRSLALGANISVVEREADRRAVQSAIQDVARMTALVDQAQVQLDRHSLQAPISGTIVALDAALGQIADTATVLMTIADLDDLIVETDVDETYANQVTVGQQAVLRFSGETQTRTGTVRTVANRVNASTGGLSVTIAFDMPVTAPIGLTVTANIIVDQRDAALTIPRTALVTTQDGSTAVFLAQNGVARLQRIGVIPWPAARLIVTEGLLPGDWIIIDSAGLSNGLRIKPEEP